MTIDGHLLGPVLRRTLPYTFPEMSGSGLARLVVFVAFFDLFCQFPIVAPFARQLGADPLVASVTVATYDVANLVGNLAAGFVLIGIGRQRTLVGGLLASAIALALYGVVAEPWQFGAVRALHGLGQAVLSPGAFTLLSDSVVPSRRAQAMGTAGAFIAIAAVIGPAVAGIAGTAFGSVVVFQAVAALMLAASAVVAFLGRNVEVSADARERSTDTVKVSLGSILRRPQLIVANVACLAWTAGIGTLVVHLPLLLETRGASASVRGTAFSVYALVSLVLFARPSPWLVNRFGRLLPLAGGLSLIGISLLGLALTTTTAGVYGAMALFGSGFGLLFPAVTSYIADHSSPSERGMAYGVFYAAYSLGVVAGEVGSGQLAEVFGAATVAPFVAFGCLALFVTPWVVMVNRRVAPVRAIAPAQ